MAKRKMGNSQKISVLEEVETELCSPVCSFSEARREMEKLAGRKFIYRRKFGSSTSGGEKTLKNDQ